MSIKTVKKFQKCNIIPHFSLLFLFWKMQLSLKGVICIMVLKFFGTRSQRVEDSFFHRAQSDLG